MNFKDFKWFKYPNSCSVYGIGKLLPKELFSVTMNHSSASNFPRWQIWVFHQWGEHKWKARRVNYWPKIFEWPFAIPFYSVCPTDLFPRVHFFKFANKMVLWQIVLVSSVSPNPSSNLYCLYGYSFPIVEHFIIPRFIKIASTRLPRPFFDVFAPHI